MNFIGAAMSKRNGVPYLAGVVSWGKGSKRKLLKYFVLSFLNV